MLINTQEQLNNALKQILRHDHLGIDTEFVRTRSYFPLLSLIQISTIDGDLYALDLHAKLDWQPVTDLLSNKDIVKVIHSCRQDIEALHYRFNIYPQNIIDTQVMAKIIGIGTQVSYAVLVEKYFNVILDKAKQFSNWNKRPLSPSQIAYALHDVQYLLPLYKKILFSLNSEDLQQLMQECEQVIHPSLYKISIERQWRRFCKKYRCKEYPPVLKTLFYFREKAGVKSNILPKLIMEDSTLFSLAHKKDIESMEKLKRILPNNRYIHYDDLLRIMRNKNKALEGGCPEQNQVIAVALQG